MANRKWFLTIVMIIGANLISVFAYIMCQIHLYLLKWLEQVVWLNEMMINCFAVDLDIVHVKRPATAAVASTAAAAAAALHHNVSLRL